MVDPALLAYDISADVSSLVIPGALWALLFLLAWGARGFADRVGLGRTAFWLLVPGGLLASFAILPIAPISDDWLAVSAAGAIFPLIVGAAAVQKYAPPARASLGLLMGLLVVETAGLLLVVLPGIGPRLTAWGPAAHLGSGGAAIVVVTAGVVVFLAIALPLLLRPSAPPSHRRIGLVLALASGVLACTFAGSSTIPGLGIAEAFPVYLLPPFAAGIAAGLAAPRLLRGDEGQALPIAFFAGTLGVLVGADVLRQPPLYGSGPAGIYTVGGAGVLDLVYLSGFLALGGALLAHWVAGRPLQGTDDAASTPDSLAALRRARREGMAGRTSNSLQDSAAAARSAAETARRVLGLPAAPPDRPWDGLPVPGWVVSDQANLDAAARAGSTDGREGYRAWLTARWLVLTGRQLALRRLASIPQRAWAFVIDLLLVGGLATAAFAAILLATPGGVAAALASLPLNAAIYGAISVGFLYFALAESLLGATLGKRLLGIAVRDRSLAPPRTVPSLVRNAPIVPILTVLALCSAIGLVFAVKGPVAGGVVVAGIAVPGGLLALLGVTLFAGIAIALLGAFGVLAIALTWERQRVGDLWAGTWVVRVATPPPPVPPPGGRRSG